MRSINQLESFFAHLISSGTINSGDPRIFAESLLSLIFGYAFALIPLSDQHEIHRDLDHLVNMINTSFLPGLE